MAEANDMEHMIYENLMDAGCDEPTIFKCMAFVREGNYEQMLPILVQHRCSLLGTVRYGQKQIDCLDYLIYQINHQRI